MRSTIRPNRLGPTRPSSDHRSGTPPVTLIAMIALGAFALVAAACSSSPSTNTVKGQSVGSHCWVGTWKLQTGMVTENLGGRSVQLTGGQGQVATIANDGSMTANFSKGKPLSGTTSAGTVTITYTGTEKFSQTWTGDMHGTVAQQTTGGNGSLRVSGAGLNITQKVQTGGSTGKVLSFTCSVTQLVFTSSGGYTQEWTRVSA